MGDVPTARSRTSTQIPYVRSTSEYPFRRKDAKKVLPEGCRGKKGSQRPALLTDVPPIAETLKGFVREQLDTWGKLIRAAKIQPE